MYDQVPVAPQVTLLLRYHNELPWFPASVAERVAFVDSIPQSGLEYYDPIVLKRLDVNVQTKRAGQPKKTSDTYTIESVKNPDFFRYEYDSRLATWLISMLTDDDIEGAMVRFSLGLSDLEPLFADFLERRSAPFHFSRKDLSLDWACKYDGYEWTQWDGERLWRHSRRGW